MLKVFMTLCLVAALKGANADAFIDAVVERHNYYRALHGVPAVTENAAITAFAQDFATYLDTNGLWHHNPNASANGYGENLSWMSNPAATGQDHVDNLYINEANFYAQQQYCGEEPNMSYFAYYGHYTQIVWESSLEIGVGKSSGYVVINYSPPGNYYNMFAENVPCPA
ncbi:Golgi-associated plant pathogenesis-related protein 1-like isoform X2 [Ruditapes philippinarum]|uniref:Golgi-associated plant pathogenesis-related protein 1-like isoform X2 n=1 Tax=Ruditapes philippinarum TaxID=129788 RepID=UPI00295AD366|nr:Golgi-associated plant pathogenesis-related protein 1-like isoform X2 [Ruditapes philippinarum]